MRRLLIYISVFFSVSVALQTSLVSCGGRDDDRCIIEEEKSEDFDAALALIDDYLSDTISNTIWARLDTMPGNDLVKLRVKGFYGNITESFNDSNYLHYGAAESLGVAPFHTESIPMPWLRRPLERVHPTEHYAIDKLYHSYAFLVPEAHVLLNDIARSFHDSLKARGGGDYRLKVTSLLRTRSTVAKLRRVNNASVDSSAHLFGTTFDISFNRFPYTPGDSPHHSQADLKALLAEILDIYRTQGRCYVIYEHRPGCFHITARK